MKTLKRKVSKKKSGGKPGTIKIKLIAMPLILVTIMVIGIILISSYMMKVSLLNQMKENGKSLSDKLISRMKDNNQALAAIDKLLEEKIITTGKIVIREKEINNDYLAGIAEASEIKEINWFDKNGVIVHSNIPDYVGWAAEEGHPVRNFLKSDKETSFEEIRKDSESDTYLKYGYVRSSEGHFVQVGILADTVQILTEKFNYQKLLEEMDYGKDIAYAYLINHNMETLAYSNTIDVTVEFNEKSVTKAIKNGTPYFTETLYKDKKITVFDVIVPVVIRGQRIGSLVIGYSTERVIASVNRNIISITLLSFAASLLLGIILYRITNGAVKTISKLKKQIAYMAAGDFTNELSKDLINQNNEFGQISKAIGTMQDSIRSMVEHIVSEANQLAASSEELNAISEQSSTSAEEVAKTIEEIAKGASNQAHETEQGTVSILELGELITANKVNIQSLNESTEQVNNLKNEGLDILKELNLQTEINKSSSNEVQSVIVNTNECAGKIVEASQMIKNIASQTNLLALNASIEAARAGEAGRGFAVVADEIRKLADASNKFTDQISEIVIELSEQTSKAVKTMEELKKVVSSQAVSVRTTNTKFNGIAEAIDLMEKTIIQVNESSDRMVMKKEEIILVIENLSAVSEENAAATEEATASVEEQAAAMAEISNSSEELARIAENLNKHVEIFKI